MKCIRVIMWSAIALAASAGIASAAGDAAAGEAIFRVCKTCHRIGEGATNFVGPELNGVVGRKAGSVPGYNYSDANKNSGVVWDEATLAKYLQPPARGRARHQDGLSRGCSGTTTSPTSSPIWSSSAPTGRRCEPRAQALAFVMGADASRSMASISAPAAARILSSPSR